MNANRRGYLRNLTDAQIVAVAVALLSHCSALSAAAQSALDGVYADPSVYGQYLLDRKPGPHASEGGATSFPASNPYGPDANSASVPAWELAPRDSGGNPYEMSAAGEPLSPRIAAAEAQALRHQAVPLRKVIPEANLQVDLPPGAWREMPLPKAKTVDGFLAVQESGIAVVMVGERIGVELNLGREGMVRASQTLLRLQTPNLQFSNEQPYTACGIEGVRYEARGEASGLPMFGVMWVAQRNGFMYQFAVIGHTSQASTIEEIHRTACDRLALVDPHRVVHAADEDLIKKFESTAFRYRVDLEGLGWMRSDEAKLAVCEFKASRANLVLVVMPIMMPGRKVDPELMAKACLGQMGFAYPSPQIRDTGPCQMGILSGRQFEAHRTTDRAEVDYRIRLATNEQATYVVVGFAVDSDAESIKILQQAVERVAIVEGQVTRDPNLQLSSSVSEAKTLNEIGLQLFQRGDLAGAHDFIAAAYKLLKSDVTLLSNYVDVLSDLGRMSEALVVLETHLDMYPGNQEVMATRARLVAKNGEPDRARRLYSELFYEGYADEDALAEYLKFAEEAEAYDEAITNVQQFALRRPTVDVQVELAGLYSAKGDHDTAISQLKLLRQQNPHNLDLAARLSIAYSDAKQHTEALATTQELLDSGQRTEVVWLLHGKNQLNAEQFSEAKQTFEKTLGQFPNSELAKELLKVAVGQLGQGDNSAIITSIAPVEIPAAVRTAIAQSTVKPADSLQRYGAEEQVRIVGVSFERNRPRRTTVSRRIKIHTAGGVSEYSTLTFDLNSLSERLYVNRLVVLDAAGKQVAQGAVETYYVRDDTSSGMATNAKTVTVPVPGLKPGYSIEVMVTREDRASSETFGFDETVLSSDVPVGVSAYYVTGDVQGLIHKSSMPLEVKKEGELIYCVTANPSPFRTESRQPAIEKFLPIVWVADAGSTWETETRDYLELIGDQLQLDEGTRKLAIELTRDCRTNREKLAVLAKYTQDSCTYHAIEFGRRGRVPNTAAQTRELKYGDCKDHSLLLQQLLRGVGIPSHLTVVNSSRALQPELVALDQFDHMVLFVPGDAIAQGANAIGGLIVDATQKNSDPLLYPSLGLADKSFLVLDPAAPRLVRTPALPLDALQLTCQRRVTLRPNAVEASLVEAEVQERLTFNSYLAPGMRGYLRSYEAGERRDAIQQVLSSSQSARLRKVEIENLEDSSRPLVVYLEYSLPDAVHALATREMGSALLGRIPSPWETFFLEPEYLEQRETPFEISNPKLVRSTVDIVLPAGYRMADAERLTGAGRTPFAAWASNARTEGSTVHLEHVVRLPAGRFKAQDYPAFYAGVKHSLSTLQAPLTFQQGTSVAASPAATLVR